MAAFGERSPSPPRLRLRNVTQTSVTLEWDKLDLATSKLLSLTIWRNGQRLAAIPNPLNNTSTKVSGLDVDAPYSFHLILRTTAGTYASQTIKTRTLTLTDTSGISVCFGAIDSPELLDEAREALTQMRARWSNRIQIETTHFVCTHPSGPAPAIASPDGSPQEAPDPSQEYQRASQLSIPIVQPAWILACLREKRMVPISAYTLDKAAISGGPSSSVSLGKNASANPQQHPPQQPREGPREPIQLQKPPPPKKSPEVAAADPSPEAQPPHASSADATVPTQFDLAPTALPEADVQDSGVTVPTQIELAPTVLPESEAQEPDLESDVEPEIETAEVEAESNAQPPAEEIAVGEAVPLAVEAEDDLQDSAGTAAAESSSPTQVIEASDDVDEPSAIKSEAIETNEKGSEDTSVPTVPSLKEEEQEPAKAAEAIAVDKDVNATSAAVELEGDAKVADGEPTKDNDKSSDELEKSDETSEEQLEEVKL